MVQNGLDVFDSFSGKGTGASCLKWIRQCLPQFAFEFCADPISVRHACDNDIVSQHVLKSFRDPATDQCEFEHISVSLESHLSKVGLEKVERLQPSPSDSPEEKADKYAQIENYLHDEPEEAFGSKITAPCVLHPGGRCPVFEAGGVERPDCNLTDSVETILSTPPSPQELDPATALDTSVGETHDPYSDGNSSQPSALGQRRLHARKRWTLLQGGSQCVDYSMRGPQMRHIGESTLPFLVWVAEICFMLPLLIIHEITSIKTEDLIVGNRRLIQAGYKGITIVLDTFWGGKPMKRPRRFTGMWLPLHRPTRWLIQTDQRPGSSQCYMFALRSFAIHCTYFLDKRSLLGSYFGRCIRFGLGFSNYAF